MRCGARGETLRLPRAVRSRTKCHSQQWACLRTTLTEAGTDIQAPLSLEGEIHPVFGNWILTNDHEEAQFQWRELRQPLLLASRILAAVGLPWLSEFCIDDIFRRGYPGPTVGEDSYELESQGKIPAKTPEVIVRHHRAAWATPRLIKAWISTTDRELRTNLPKYVQWQLNDNIFAEFGWVGYTCRHYRAREWTAGDTPLRERPEDIIEADEAYRRQGATNRPLTVLVMKEYVSRLRELRTIGLFGREEYLFTAFMAAVTLLHELGHAMYRRDFRALNRRMTEPYFGGDLEMELGDSFIASIFGGWIPVPIADENKFRVRGTFDEGLAWKEHLSWDSHKTRPEYRTHSSIPVRYIANLFDDRSWKDMSCAEHLIRPPTLMNSLQADSSLSSPCRLVLVAETHASAALADFVEDWDGGGLCFRWKRRPAADFRIPLYRGTLRNTRGERCVSTVSRMAPPEPDVCDKVLTEVKIRAELPNSEAALHSRLRKSWRMSPGVTLTAHGDRAALGAAIDLRKMTGVGLRHQVAKALDLPVKHVKVRPGRDDDEATAGTFLGSCILSAYARGNEGAGLALRLSTALG
ncbi:hypothetical protein QBC34DRAFT_298285 [Podospora aff. communis PSN243]|uniref:Uncharacterized protein n=1 Tax=Podospora aff. communis PSN243 TaxID=3040156 RepID=A0AAV9GNX7_9PEZI|nr:hypothetical protein QBC34DRAFT_298285 [Podospora aff. communis PSN243]